MNAARGLRPLTIALLALIVATAVLIARSVAVGTHTEALLATAARIAPAAPDRLALRRHALELAAIQDRPILYSTRRNYVPPPPPTIPVGPPRPNFRLAGTFVIPGKPTIALVVDNATGVSRKVKPGDDLNGWAVQAVENRRIVLAYAAESMELLSALRPPNAALKEAPLARSPPPRLPVRRRSADEPRRPATAASLDGPPQL